jgi:hypothetical protein
MLLVVSASGSFAGQLSLPTVFSDHMVLQREQPVPVWGTAGPETTVTVEFSGQRKTATADTSGKWKLYLDPLAASVESRELSVSSGDEKQVFNDVLVGEVWFCSGQSNMEMPLGGWAPTYPLNDSEAEVAAATHPYIRLYDTPSVYSQEPVEPISSHWKTCTPGTVGSFSAIAYYFGRKLQQDLDVPVGLILSAWNATKIEPWIAPSGFAEVDSLAESYAVSTNIPELTGDVKLIKKIPSVLYNGMIYAHIPYAIRGAIWYQGESNHNDGMLYVDKTRALLNGWRGLWGYDFPFYFVQIAPFAYPDGDPGILPGFWEAQGEIVNQIPNTGMVVVNDCAVTNNIHPPNKKDPGIRLALLAEANTYGMDVVCTGPVFRSLERVGDALKVNFDSAEGLTTRDGKTPDWFESAGPDGVFRTAAAEIQGSSVILRSPDVTDPVAMRFAWHRLAMPNLMNGAGLPAFAFRAQFASSVVWDGGADDGNKWATAANWNPDMTPNAMNDFDFTGSSINVLDANITAKTLIGGAESQLRVRHNGKHLIGDLVMTGTVANASVMRMVETGDQTRALIVDDNATFGNTTFKVDESGDTLTLAVNDLVTLNSTIYKAGNGTLSLNLLGSLRANNNTLVINGGDVVLRGNVDYSGLNIDVQSGALNISNYNVSVASLTIDGTAIDPGTYAPGDEIYTRWADYLLNGGGALTVLPVR